MSRRNTYVVALIVASGAVFAGVYLATVRGEAAASAKENPAPAPGVVAPAAAAPIVATPAPPATPSITPDAVARWISDTASADAGKRATAIAALAGAPRADVVPVLRRILTEGEPQVDRPLALRSLRELALTQGDKDGAIRDAVRHAIYHGDDQTNTVEAQDALDTIEESEQK